MDIHRKSEGDEDPLSWPVPYKKKSSLKKKNKNSKDADSRIEAERETYHKNLIKQNRYMPVIDHIEEFRWTMIRSVLWILLFSVLSIAFIDEIYKVIINPIGHLIDTGKHNSIIVKLIVTQLSDYVVIQFKLSLIVGFLISVPAILFEILRFVMPAFEIKYKKWSYLVLLVSVLLFWSGIYIAWRYCWDLVIEFLVLSWIPPGIETQSGIQMPEVHLTLGDYLSSFMSFHLTVGIAFQLPIICVILATTGIINSRIYFKQWRIVLLVIAVVSAVVTPPDALSMTVMMVPMCLLYIISGLFVLLFEKRTVK